MPVKLGDGGKIFGRVAMGLSIGTAAYDIYKAAPEDRGNVAAKSAGGLAGMYLGAKAGGMAGGAIGSAFGGVGAIPGAVIGSILGGIGGSIWGNNLADGILNGTFGADRLRSMKEAATYHDNEVRGTTYEDYDAVTDSMEKATETRSQAISGLWSTMWESLKTGGQTAVSTVENAWDGAVSWFDSSVWSPLKTAASSAGSAIENAFSSAWASVEGVWGSVAEWFESHVADPISAKISQISANALSRYSFANGSVSVDSSVPMDAVGDYNFPGGLAQINEHGGELIDLPQGSRIYPAEKSARIIAREAQSRAGSSPSVTVTGNTFVVRNEADMDKIAYTIMRALEQGYANYGGA